MILAILQAAAAAANTAVEHKSAYMDLVDNFPLVNFIVLIFGGVGMYFGFKKNGRDSQDVADRNEQKIKAQIHEVSAVFDKRVDRLEQRSSEFMPKGEIEKEINHAKNNAMTATSILSESVRANAKDIIELRVAMGKIEQKHEGLEDDVGAIKTELREVRVELKQGFREVHEALLNISRKV